MTLTINLDNIRKSYITPNEVFYLIGIHQKQPVKYYVDLTNLESRGYIKRSYNDETGLQELVLRGPALKLMKTLKLESMGDIETFVDEYRTLFPVGVKTNGVAVRGDKQACIKKMKEFTRIHDYTKEEILEAIRVYLVIKKKDNWKFTQTAHNFIEKDGVSQLSAMCEDIRLNGTKSNITEEIRSTGTVEGI